MGFANHSWAKLSNHWPVFFGIVCLVTLKIGGTIPKKSTGYQIFFLFIFILKID